MPILVLCKKKYRAGGRSKKTLYKARTGPLCCNANCGAAWRRKQASLKRKGYNFGIGS